MFRVLFGCSLLLFASSVSAQPVVGSFERNGVEISLMADGRWGIVGQTELECGSFPQIYACTEHATEFSEDFDLAPFRIDFRGVRFSDFGVFVGRTWGTKNTDIFEVARGFMKDLAEGYDVPDGGIRLISTDTGKIGAHTYVRYEFLSELEAGPLWSTVTRIRAGSRTADVGTHVFGEAWTVSPEMLVIRKDFHQRLIENLPVDWVSR